MSHSRKVSYYGSDSNAFSLPQRKFLTLQAITEYYNDLNPNSDYLKDMTALTEHAKQYLLAQVALNKEAKQASKLAIILDLDDTGISHYFNMKHANYSNTSEEIDERYHSAKAVVIPPTLDLHKTAITHGVSVFFVSYRTPMPNKPNEDLKPYTIKNMKIAGYADWSDLFIPKPTDAGLPSYIFKTNVRMELSKTYRVIFSMGDQDSDLIGGYTERTYKMPNYLYSTSPTPECMTADKLAKIECKTNAKASNDDKQGSTTELLKQLGATHLHQPNTALAGSKSPLSLTPNPPPLMPASKAHETSAKAQPTATFNPSVSLK